MRQSNLYVILFALVLTIVFGGALSMTSEILKPIQKKQVELDTKKKILGAVRNDITSIEIPEKIITLYNKRVKSIVVDYQGNEITKDKKGNLLVAEEVNIQKNSKLPKKERAYPVFIYLSENGEPESYILPTFGSGLWDWISSFVALDKNFNIIQGIAFDHKSETPGLGARITEENVRNRYKGKKIFDSDDKLLSVTMVKGEGNTGLSEYQVDGMSGATMTAKGVNSMLKQYFECYKGFIEKTKSKEL